jgi:hypothetical protein
VPTILQVTDLHLRHALPGHNGHTHRLSRHMPALLDSLAERIRAEDPDFVAVTGDLLDVPHALLDGDESFDLKKLVRAAIADYRLVENWLQGLGRPWMVLPGNHDYAPAFDVVFGSAPRTMIVGGVTVHAFHDWEQAGNQALRIGSSRRHFEEVIAAATDATNEIHLQHFVVRPLVDYGYPLLYGDADDLAARAALAPGRRLVLSGHWHEGTAMVTEGNARFGVCPAFCEPPHPYRIFTVTPDGAVDMRQDELGRSFAPDTPLILVDRAGLLTGNAEGTGPRRFGIRDEAAAILNAVSPGAHVAVASGWHEPESDAATWRGVQYLHDAFFHELAEHGGQADAFAIYLPLAGPGAKRLPAETIATEGTLIARLAELFGTVPQRVIFLTANAPRRHLARQAGAICPELDPAPDAATVRRAVQSVSGISPLMLEAGL